jgi:NAD(P)-dependent dehydrogenase (short-subunit alcohol dehydrogenase family)
VPEALVAGALDRFGRLDILVNNAAIAGGTRFEQLSAEEWRTAFEESGVVLCCARATGTANAAATADAIVISLKRVMDGLSRRLVGRTQDIAHLS